MATDKKSIVVYADWLDNFESLSDEEAGRLVKHFFRYVNDLNPVPVDRITEISFIPLKNTLKRDLRKWEKKLEERSISGRMGNLKRWNPDLHTQVEAKTITLQEAEVIAIDRKTSLSDKNDTVATENIENIAVSDSVSVSVSVNDILLKKETKDIYIPSFDDFLLYALEKEPTVKKSALKNKYDSWIENNWRDGNDKKITNWKTKLLNTMPYIDKEAKKLFNSAHAGKGRF